RPRHRGRAERRAGPGRGLRGRREREVRATGPAARAARRPAATRRQEVNIDVTALKAVEREKGIPADTVLQAIETALVTAYRHGSRLKAYVVSVTRTFRGPQVTLSRTHPNLVRKLFALEAPEVADGSVEIVSVAREAGHRSKIAVRTSVPGLNAKGSCIGPMCQRVCNVVSGLDGEKIDILALSAHDATFVG